MLIQRTSLSLVRQGSNPGRDVEERGDNDISRCHGVQVLLRLYITLTNNGEHL